MRRQGKGCTGFPQNIILTGFMGCGKTTVGRLLAAALHLPFVDADHEIEKAAGMEIPAIFQACGEPYFRRLEEEQIEKLRRIAAGGCAMTPNLSKHSSLIVRRLPNKSPISHRPLHSPLIAYWLLRSFLIAHQLLHSLPIAHRLLRSLPIVCSLIQAVLYLLQVAARLCQSVTGKISMKKEYPYICNYI